MCPALSVNVYEKQISVLLPFDGETPCALSKHHVHINTPTNNNTLHGACLTKTVQNRHFCNRHFSKYSKICVLESRNCRFRRAPFENPRPCLNHPSIDAVHKLKYRFYTMLISQTRHCWRNRRFIHDLTFQQ